MPAATRIAQGQSYLTRPVRLIEGFGAVGGPDIVGQWLSEQFRQPYLVENRPGANGNIATEVTTTARLEVLPHTPALGEFLSVGAIGQPLCTARLIGCRGNTFQSGHPGGPP
jgi:tripartite-type tricarboxylate transporter receptor subunit TctC